MKVWLAKVGVDGESDMLVGVFDTKQKAINAALRASPKISSPYIEDPASNDSYVRYSGDDDVYAAADAWEVL